MWSGIATQVTISNRCPCRTRRTTTEWPMIQGQTYPPHKLAQIVNSINQATTRPIREVDGKELGCPVHRRPTAPHANKAFSYLRRPEESLIPSECPMTTWHRWGPFLNLHSPTPLHRLAVRFQAEGRRFRLGSGCVSTDTPHPRGLGPIASSEVRT